MAVLYLIIVGAGVGFIATRLMKIELGIGETIAVGVLGALIGGFVSASPAFVPWRSCRHCWRFFGRCGSALDLQILFRDEMRGCLSVTIAQQRAADFDDW